MTATEAVSGVPGDDSDGIGGGEDDDNNFVSYPLALKVRNFRNNNPKNAFVFAVFDCCR